MQALSELIRRYRVRQELKRLAALPRFQPTHTHVFGRRFLCPDGPSFVWTYYELFQREIYAFDTDNPRPVILDCGANCGMSILYFKQRFPHCRITAFEADPRIATILDKNIRTFQWEDVTLRRQALWDADTTLPFLSEGADGGRLFRPEDDSWEMPVIHVPTIRLPDCLEGPVDFLKIDIEGAEAAVLADCRGCLNGVARIFVEYHSFPDAPQALADILDVLGEAGFRVQIQPVHNARQPLLCQEIQFGMDLQVNIFGWRPETALKQAYSGVLGAQRQSG